MTKKTFCLIFLTLLSLPVFGAIRIKVNAPGNVATGEDFRIEYYVSTRDIDNFTGPKFPSSINVLYGPSRSEMSSYQIINGKSSGTSSVTFTYTCTIDKAGTVSIPPAAFKINGKTYKTNTVTIHASGSTHHTPNSANTQQQDQTVTPSSNGRITAKDLFITVSANKTSVCEQEPIVLTYKIYTRVNLTQLSGKMPDLKGFLIQEVPLPKNKTFSIENYKGENYQTTKWCQYVMFPQQTGKLQIPSIKFDGIVAIANPNIDPFDAFFNGNSNFAEVKKSIIAPSLSINVSKLPTPKPSDFSGAVGNFKIASSILTPKPRTNENLSVRLAITGTGNMKLITAPKLNLGSDFEVFPAKLTDKTSLTANGMSGTIYYDYTVVPHQKGNYTLPAINLEYYDTASGYYKTASSQPISFRVEQGANQPSDDEDLLRKDINDIHRGSYSTPSQFFTLTNGGFYAVFAGLIALFAVAFLVLKRSENFRSNTTLRMQVRAKRTATKHLRKAEKLMNTGNAAEFYDELANALTAYISHRLTIPMSEFKTDEIESTLLKNGVSQNLCAEFTDLMKQCEFARFAPGNPQENMENLYSRSAKVIVDIENSLR